MQEMDQTVNSVHENHRTRQTFPMAKPMVPTHLGRPKIRTFPGPFQDLGQIYKDLQLTYDN